MINKKGNIDMNIIRFINENTDPFIMQLVVVPILSIGGGIYAYRKTSKLLLATVTTLILSCMYTIFFIGEPINNVIGILEIILTILSFRIALILKFRC